MYSLSGQMRMYDATNAMDGARTKAAGKRGRSSRRSETSTLRNERMFDMEYLDRVMLMYTTIPGFKFARRSMVANVFCHAFKVKFKNWPGSDGKNVTVGDEIEDIIDRHWMPFCRDVYDHMEVWGLCPYVWEQIGDTDHWYPRVPIRNTYTMSYEEDRDGRVYRLYWTDECKLQEAVDVFWIRGDLEPESGVLRTAVAALLPEYDLYLTNMNAHITAITNGVHPYHLLEYHPKNTDASIAEIQDTYVAYGNRAALAALQQHEAPQQMVEESRHSSMMKSLHLANEFNHGSGWPDPAAKTAEELDLARTQSQFLQRTTALNSDYKYQAAARSMILMPLAENWRKLNDDASSALGLPSGLSQSRSSQHNASVEANAHALNTNVKCILRDFTRIIKRVWTISPSGQRILQLNKMIDRERSAAAKAAASSKPEKKWMKEKKRKKARRRRRVPWKITPPTEEEERQIFAHVEVEIEFSYTPNMSYDQLRGLYLDKVLSSHEVFVQHAADMFGLGQSALNLGGGKLAEEEQMALTKKVANAKLSAGIAAAKGSPPLAEKKHKTVTEEDAVNKQ